MHCTSNRAGSSHCASSGGSLIGSCIQLRNCLIWACNSLHEATFCSLTKHCCHNIALILSLFDCCIQIRFGVSLCLALIATCWFLSCFLLELLFILRLILIFVGTKSWLSNSLETDLERFFEFLLFLYHFSELISKSSWCLFNNCFFHSLVSVCFIDVVSLCMINNLVECPEFTVWTLAFIWSFLLRPFQKWSPTIFWHNVSYFVSVRPVIIMIYFICQSKFGFLRKVFLLESINWGLFTSCICKKNLISLSPVFISLLKFIQTLASRWLVKWLLHCPVESIFLIIGKLWELCAMNA